jgi:hypothetical protein
VSEDEGASAVNEEAALLAVELNTTAQDHFSGDTMPCDVVVLAAFSLIVSYLPLHPIPEQKRALAQRMIDQLRRGILHHG